MAFDVQTEHRKKAKQQGSREGHGEHLGDWKNLQGRLPGGGEVERILEGKVEVLRKGTAIVKLLQIPSGNPGI